MNDQDGGATPDETTPFEQLPARAQVELDRFCDGCGYNLRTQYVRRDPRLNMLLLRCPECGRFHSAADATSVTRPWLRRLAMLGLLLWIVVVVGSPIGVGAAHVGLSLGTLEELTTWRRVDNGPRNRWHLVVHDNYEYRELFLSSVLGATFALAFTGIALAAVVFHHWRRAWYLVVTAVMAAGAAVLVGLIWHADHPALFGWSLPYVYAHAAAHLLGGALGALFGRAAARLVIRVVLPLGLRPHLAFLWLADGKQPPLRRSS